MKNRNKNYDRDRECNNNGTLVGGALGAVVAGVPGMIVGGILGHASDNNCRDNDRKQYRNRK